MVAKFFSMKCGHSSCLSCIYIEGLLESHRGTVSGEHSFSKTGLYFSSYDFESALTCKTLSFRRMILLDMLFYDHQKLNGRILTELEADQLMLEL